MRRGVGKSIGILAVTVTIMAAAACGYDWTVVPKKETDGIGSAPDNNNTSSGKVPGKASVCKSSLDCNKGSYCAFLDHQCGKGELGQCETLGACDGQAEIVCGCNGNIFKSRCEAQAAGDVGLACTAPNAAPFPCGFLFCQNDQLCIETTKGGLTDYECVDWNSCKPRDCSCPELSVSTCKCETRKDNLVVAHCGEG